MIKFIRAVAVAGTLSLSVFSGVAFAQTTAALSPVVDTRTSAQFEVEFAAAACTPASLSATCKALLEAFVAKFGATGGALATLTAYFSTASITQAELDVATGSVGGPPVVNGPPTTTPTSDTGSGSDAVDPATLAAPVSPS